MSLEPVASAEKVYKFIGRDIPDSMRDFLIEHTTVQKKGRVNRGKMVNFLLNWLSRPFKKILNEKIYIGLKFIILSFK